jgi:hypothetical protein
MPAPFFTTNPSEFTRLEGLYINEKNPPGFITGISLNNVGVCGQTVRGPVDTAVEIGSPQRFIEVFGGRDYGAGGALINQVWRFLLNKPFGSVTVVRAAAAAAVKASFTVETGINGLGTAIARIDASSVGTWGNNVYIRVEDASDGDSTHWNLRLNYLGKETLYENLNTSTGYNNLTEVVGDDHARLIDIAKLADGRPANFATITEAGFEAADTESTDPVGANFIKLGTTLVEYVTVAGTNGTVAATDYTAANRALAQITDRKGIAVVAYAETDNTIVDAINDQIEVAAAASNDRMFVIWSGTHGDSPSTVMTDAGGRRHDRIIYCYNSPYTLDPETAVQIQTPPSDWMASILSQIDVDIHPGEEATKEFTAGITRLTKEDLTRTDYINLRAAGICALENDDGFVFVSGVTTSLTSGKTEITRRRMADYLQLSAANRLKFYVKKKNTTSNRSMMVGELTAFCRTLQDDERIVEDFVIDNDTVNTPTTRAQGIEKILWRVRLIGHILHLVLETEIGTGVTIEA